MHPDLYLVVYRQAERELEQRIERARLLAERRAAATGSAARPGRWAALRPAPGLAWLRPRGAMTPSAPMCAECAA
jgi:hypothetical protein